MVAESESEVAGREQAATNSSINECYYAELGWAGLLRELWPACSGLWQRVEGG